MTVIMEILQPTYQHVVDLRYAMLMIIIAP